MDLVARSRAEFEDSASSGADKGGDNGGVFIGDETVGYVQQLVCRDLAQGQGAYNA